MDSAKEWLRPRGGLFSRAGGRKAGKGLPSETLRAKIARRDGGIVKGFRVKGLKGRTRIKEAIRRRTACRISSAGSDTVEVLLLARGTRNAIERNRLRRRGREAVRALAGELNLGGKALLLELNRSLLALEWKDFLRRIRSRLVRDAE